MVESTAQVEDKPKHDKLDQGAHEEVEIMENKFTRNLASPFINQQRSWEEGDHFTLSSELQKGITEELGFLRPSNIQAVAIPLINKKDADGNYSSLIAQGKNGSGKTGAFSIGSLIRVDPMILKPQIIVVCHVRELASQITEVYEKITKFSDIKVSNFTQTGKSEGCQVVVMTLGKLESSLKARKAGIDLSEVRAIVVDEADFFFNEEKNLNSMKNVVQKYLMPLKQKIQFILFSATYPENVKKAISEIITEAQQIKMSNEQLQLNHIQQFEFRADPKKKPDFVKEVFAVCEMTSSIIFVNTKKFAFTLHEILKKAGLKSALIFGESPIWERDEYIQKFRTGEVAVIITTNLLARGIDVPEVQIVINYDVPTMRVQGKQVGDPENYLHRIGRTGRFGTKGIAVTIYDRDVDKEFLSEIMEHYKMQSKLKVMSGPAQLKTLLEEIGDSAF